MTINSNFIECVNILREGGIIAYPTESVFGLGCDPDNEKAVKKLLKLKKRPLYKGFILIAHNFEQIKPYVKIKLLSETQKEKLLSSWPGNITWVLPVDCSTPVWLTGKFNSLAVRITKHPVARKLCKVFNKPIISTSANINGQIPCRSIAEVNAAFKNKVPTLLGKVGSSNYPSKIYDALTGNLIRG